MLTKEYVRSLKEAELCQEVLIPLLNAMGYKDVYYFHGGESEKGKDIICWKNNDLGIRKNIALVVKSVAISGRVDFSKGTAGVVSNQIRQCFSADYNDPISLDRQRIHEVWVVTNKSINKIAIDSIDSMISSNDMNRSVTILDGNKLWEKIQEYLPQQKPFVDRLHEIQNNLESLDQDFLPILERISPSGIKFSIKEKGSKKLEFPIEFRFPDTQIGREKLKELQESIDTGRLAVIPSDFISSIKLPSIYSKLFGFDENFKPEITFHGIQDLPLLNLSFHIFNNLGFNELLENIELKAIQAGSKERTYESQNEIIPLKIRMTIKFEEKKLNLEFTQIMRPSNAAQYLKYYKFINILHKPCTLILFDYEKQIEIITINNTNDLGKDYTNSINFFEDLFTIQKKINKEIIIPLRKFSDSENKILQNLFSMIHEPIVFGTWKDQFSVDISKNELLRTINVIKKLKEMELSYQGGEHIKIFNVKFDIEPILRTYYNAKLINLSEVEKFLADDKNENDEIIKLMFNPSVKKGKVKIEYKYWLPNDN